MFKSPFSALMVLVCVPAFPSSVSALELGERAIRRTEVITGVKAQFSTMDRNRDGVVDEKEFEGYRASQAKLPDGGAGIYHVGSRWFEKSDANGDSHITPAEAQARPLQMFDLADANHDGIASIPEQKLAMMLKGLGG